MGIKYNKLVRDFIPEIIESTGRTCTTEILSDEDYLKMLDAKLDEELAEYHKDQNIEELADLLEVLNACVIARGYTLDELEWVRAEKAAKRGGFEKKILLKYVTNPDAEGLEERIIANQKNIISEINPSMVQTYEWLMDNLHMRNVSTDREYRRKYGGFYQMRFVTDEFRDAYFLLMEEMKGQLAVSFEMVAKRLFSECGKHEFSFITKLLHTIDPTKPIYDSRVDCALEIKRLYHADFDQKLQQDARILQQLSDTYLKLAESSRMKEVMESFDCAFPGNTLTVQKKLDFILWGLGRT